MTRIDCEMVAQHLMDFLYEELGPEERTAIEAHVQGCARCAAQVEGLRATRRSMRRLEEVEPSAQGRAAILARAAAAVQAEAARRPGSAHRWRLLWATPVVVAVAAFVLFLRVKDRAREQSVAALQEMRKASEAAPQAKDEGSTAPAAAAPAPAVEPPPASRPSPVTPQVMPPGSGRLKARGATELDALLNKAIGSSGGAAPAANFPGPSPKSKRSVSSGAGSAIGGLAKLDDQKGGVAASPTAAAAKKEAPKPDPAEGDPGASAEREEQAPLARSAQAPARARAPEQERADSSRREGSAADLLYRTMLAEKQCSRVLDQVAQLERLGYEVQAPDRMKQAYLMRARCQSSSDLAAQDRERARQLDVKMQRTRSLQQSGADPAAGAPAAAPTTKEPSK